MYQRAVTDEAELQLTTVTGLRQQNQRHETRTAHAQGPFDFWVMKFFGISVPTFVLLLLIL